MSETILNTTAGTNSLPPKDHSSDHNELSNEILTLIFIMIAVYHLNQFLEKFKIARVIKPNMVTVLIGLLIGFVSIQFYSEDTLKDLRLSLSNLFNVFLLPAIMFEKVYSIRKDRVMLDKLGTLFLQSLLPLILKVLLTSLIFHMCGLFPHMRECALFSLVIYAQSSLNVVNQLITNDVPSSKIIFYNTASLLYNVLTIIVSSSLHQLLNQEVTIQKLAQQMFINVFFTLFIGISMAFISSYCLKSQIPESQDKNFDNFDIIMMVVPPLVSYLLAEAFFISGLMSLMTCAFVQSIYAKNNLERGRTQLLQRTFKAISYTSRSICDLLIGVSCALFTEAIKFFHPLHLILTIIVVAILSYGGSFIVSKLLVKKKLINESDQLILDSLGSIRGLLALSLALLQFNVHIVALTIVNVLFCIIIIEPILLYRMSKNISQKNSLEDSMGVESSNQETEPREQEIGCFKHCLLNIHAFTLSRWLLRSNNSQQFQHFNDTNTTQIVDGGNIQVIEMSQLGSQRSFRHMHKSVYSDQQQKSASRLTEKKRKGSQRLSRSTPANMVGHHGDEIALKNSVFQ